MVEPARVGSFHPHSSARRIGLVNHSSEMAHASSEPTLASSSSAPALSLRCSIATTNLGRRLMMGDTELSRRTMTGTMSSDPSMRPPPPPSPLSCARRLREQRTSSSALDQSMTQTLGSSRPKNGTAFAARKERRGSQVVPGFTLRSDDEVEAAIEARLRERGAASNPHTWSDYTPPSVIESRREQERMRQEQRARADLSKRISEQRERGEPLPSEIPWDDRQEEVMLRKMDAEMQTMLRKVTRSRNSYQEITSIPGAAEAFCKSSVRRNYVLC
mmetsp:Transcript_58298/g.104374  ORF Transcript_58298/g.104374 Transcript_58298/m.104374 type:complete len:274 (-) Transcript_58298:81-902(-)